MIISNKGKCAIRVMMYLSGNSENIITIQEIYEKEVVSKRYLEQVVADLKHNNLITSVKGKKGGYYLSKQPSEITVKDLLLAVDSPLFSLESESYYTKNDIEVHLDAHLWDPFNEHILNYFNTITLASLIDSYNKNYSNMFYI